MFFITLVKGAVMNFIRNVLLVILFVQFLIFLYVKLVYEKNLDQPFQNSNPNIQQQIALETLVEQSIHEIVDGAKALPQSSEYTVWDEAMVAELNKEIQKFNSEMKEVVVACLPKEAQQEVEETKAKEKPKKIQNEQKVIKPKKVKKIKKASPLFAISKKIEKYAKAKLGQKYVWGATGPNTFDCSGFTRNVYRKTTGIKIPRVSRDQAKVGSYVKFKELRRGDMVFFDTEKKYTGKVNHVGIYLSNNNFIHASSARKKVIITNFKKKPFYKKRFLWGRRIIKNAS